MSDHNHLSTIENTRFMDAKTVKFLDGLYKKILETGRNLNNCSRWGYIKMIVKIDKF